MILETERLYLREMNQDRYVAIHDIIVKTTIFM